MKLKTLKDLGYINKDIWQWELKQEAIKWVKEEIREYGGIFAETRRWMERFNITEEDLK